MTNLPIDAQITLMDLFLDAELGLQHFEIKGVPCEVVWQGDHAYLMAATPDFEVAVIYPGWCAGEHSTPPIIVIDGEAHSCMQWLPISRADKHSIIANLPISPVDQMLCWNAI